MDFAALTSTARLLLVRHDGVAKAVAKAQPGGLMVMVGVLAECHPDHVVLTNGVKIAVREGLLPEGAEFGRSLTITYTTDGDEKCAQDIKLVPDWLTDWMDEHGHELPDEAPLAPTSARSTSRVA